MEMLHNRKIFHLFSSGFGQFYFRFFLFSVHLNWKWVIYLSICELDRFFHHLQIFLFCLISPHTSYSMQSTVSHGLWNRFQQFQSVADRPRSGKTRITTAAKDVYIRIHDLRHRPNTPMDTAGGIPGLMRVSTQTIRNRLREVSFTG